MCTDMYKTFIPVKRTTLSMVLAIVELTARLRGEDAYIERIHAFAARKPAHHRGAVVETMLDLLDLYVQHHKATKIGGRFDLTTFIDTKIRLNVDLERANEPRYLYHCTRCEGDDGAWPGDSSIRRTARGQEGTMRFVFDAEAARQEQETVEVYFKEEFEEYEVEVEEPVPPPPQYEERGGYHGYRDRDNHRRGGYGYRGERGHRGRGRGRHY